MGKSTELGMSVCSSETRIILVGKRGRHQNGWKQNMAPMWKKLMKLMDLGEPTSFLDHYIWDVLNSNANGTRLF